MSSGDGWTRCSLGHRHWGLFGAAGLLVVRENEVLLQLRAPHTHNGDTWSVPGGARESGESSARAALREANEEVGLHESDVELGAEFVDDHGGWGYTTVLARLLRPVVLSQNHESAQVRWVPLVEVASLPLHLGFAASWGELRSLIPTSTGGAQPTSVAE